MSFVYRFSSHQKAGRQNWALVVVIFLYLISVSAVVPGVEDYVPVIDAPDITREFERRSETPDDWFDDSVTLDEESREDAPRIVVNKFVFRQVPEDSKAGVTREKVEALAERLRQEHMKAGIKTDSGFTAEELSDIVDLLEDTTAGKRPEEIHLSDFDELLSLLRLQSASRGITYTDIENVARQITQFYRERGFVLARAYIPPQEVHDGVVTLDIIPGTLGKVKVDGQRRYRTRQLQKAFNNQIDKMVDNAKVEESIYLLNDYPGLNVFGYFDRGDNLGETNLNLQVREEKGWNLAVRTDNHGSEYTGRQRVYTLADWHNPIGIGDQLSLGYLKSFSPTNTDLYQINYNLPLFRADTRLELFAERNDFSISSKKEDVINILNMTGANKTYSATVMHQLKRSRVTNLATGIKISDKRVSRDADFLLFNEGDHAQAVEVIFQGDRLSSRIRSLNMGYLSLQYGRFKNDVPQDRGDNFFKLSLDTNSLFFVPLPLTESVSRLVLKSKWRYGNTALPSFEQMSLAGPYGVRAYQATEFAADTGVYLGAEWYFELPGKLDFELRNSRYLSDIMQYAVFMDVAYGNENSYKLSPQVAKPPDPWAHMAGAGVLLRFNWDDRFITTMTVAKPLGAKSGNGLVGNEAKSWLTYVDATIKFN